MLHRKRVFNYIIKMILRNQKFLQLGIIVALVLFGISLIILLFYLVNLQNYRLDYEDQSMFESDLSFVAVENVEGVVAGVIKELEESKIVLVDEGTQDRHEFSLINDPDVIVLMYDQDSNTYPKKTMDDLKLGDRAEVHYFIDNGVKNVESIIVGVNDEV